MGILSALVERRDSLENPKTSLSNPDAWLWDAFGASRSTAGVRVNERTALQTVPVAACIRLLANTIASLPLPTYERLEKGKQSAPSHPVYRLLHGRPNPEMSSFIWREVGMGHLCTWGNFYCEIETNNAGVPIALWPLRPDATVVKRRPGGARYYETNVDGTTYTLDASRVLHIPGLGFDGLVGYSPIRLHREAIGLTVAAEEFGARFFGDGSRPAGVLTHPGKLGPDAKSRIAEGWKKAFGGVSNSHRTAILEEGVKWESIGLPPDDSQFLQTRKFQVAEIARMYGVPPHMIGDLERATFSNIEHQGIEFAVHSIRPWAVRWEQILNHDLFTPRERDTYFCEFNLEGLLRGDSTQRAQFYKELFAVGALSVNDVREKENLNPVEGGDQRFVPLNVVPLDMAREAVMRKTPTDPAPASPKRSAPTIAADAVMPACLEVTERMLRRELTQVRRAARRAPGEFPAWVDEFYGQQRDAIAQAYAPVVESLARLFLPASRAAGFARAWADECALRQVQHAREDLASIAAALPAEFEARLMDLAQRWEGERALMLASADARRLAEVLQRETMDHPFAHD